MSGDLKAWEQEADELDRSGDASKALVVTLVLPIFFYLLALVSASDETPKDCSWVCFSPWQALLLVGLFIGIPLVILSPLLSLLFRFLFLRNTSWRGVLVGILSGLLGIIAASVMTTVFWGWRPF